MSSPASKIEMLVSIYFPKCMEDASLLKQCDVPFVAFNLQMEATEKKFDGAEFIECMMSVKHYCERLRQSLLRNYAAELRLY